MCDAAGPGTLDSDTAQLVARARAGDLHAFGTLVDRHARAARRVAAAALAAPDDADDVVQEACVTAWQRLGDLSDPGSFGRGCCVSPGGRRSTGVDRFASG